MLWQAGAIVLLAITLGVLVNKSRPNRLPLAADWSVEDQLTLDPGEIMVISLEEARDLFFSQTVVFLDARSPELYEHGHILGARNLPWEAMDEYFGDVMADTPQDVLIITYCDIESCNWSKDLALALFYAGYENIRVLVNGWTLWQEAHLPIERGSTT